ncbi:amphi-Trp domain-containing protein [Desulfococcus sp.]|uniref:amphi-Trp domain-containing protein n=1 Tax=Desulfococcus sp. TaxID=2025834 RepID=UPI0035938533
MKNEIKIKQTMELATATKILKDLAASFEEGTICFEKGEEFVTLRPGNLIDLEMEAEMKKDKQKLSIELCWRTVEPKKKEAPAIKISSQEPEMIAPTPEESDTGETGSDD